MNTFEMILKDIPPGVWMILCFAFFMLGTLAGAALQQIPIAERPLPAPPVRHPTPTPKDIEAGLRALGAQEKSRKKRAKRGHKPRRKT